MEQVQLESTFKTSLSSLPREVLSRIFTDPRRYDLLRVDDPAPQKLGLFISEESQKLADEAAGQLRVLSQTCRSLRAFALPVLWVIVHVKTIDQLGRLRETLRVSPSIATHIRSFCFTWSMMDSDLELYPEEAGSALDLAFVNRYDVWKAWAARLGVSMEVDSTNQLRFYATNHQLRFYAGSDQLSVFAPGYYETQDPARNEHGEPCFDPSMPRIGGHGPDGNGEDRFIKNPAQLDECIVDVLGRLSSLETFGWCTSHFLFPVEALDALQKVTSLRSLNCDIGSPRNVDHLLPLWQLAGNLTELSMELGAPHCDEQVVTGEQEEAKLMSFDLPSSIPAEPHARAAAELSVAYRTIATAARGGQLRRLRFSARGLYSTPLQIPFAVRTLLPFWVGIDRWDFGYCNAKDWVGAAVSLRPLLAHASLWLSTTPDSSERSDRILTCTEVQSLLSHFKQHGFPEIGQICIRWVNPEWSIDAPVYVQRYLLWLEQDAQLAQRVADAWNVVVERGGADAVLPKERGRLRAAGIGRGRNM